MPHGYGQDRKPMIKRAADSKKPEGKRLPAFYIITAATHAANPYFQRSIADGKENEKKVLLVTQRNELYYPQEVLEHGKI